MSLAISWESLDRLIADGLEDLAVLHWEEVEIDKEEIPLDLNFDMARAFERAGQFRAAGLRRDGELIGYAVFVIMAPMFHRTILHAFCEGIYVDPPYRGHGLALVLWCERTLAEEGVRRIYISERISADLSDNNKPARLGALLTALGYTMSERRHSKVLGGGHVRRRPGARSLPAP
jgi:GNAT superfamily N-acetyltransferase